MPTSPMAEFLQQLRGTALLPAGAAMTDGELLEGFVTRRDEWAGADGRRGGSTGSRKSSER
jgi:hypothetical protein